ncbi:adipocyte plasma membrane-associated protein [Galendromus occidentalis]|uniref:Adipocyte plasma membrane-associated protein n=1 Tax=Galendromus occidentalis TaxID=34638 RepID=A0AAJ6QSM7_9ACAR|nr:adipocyte plasma membrane-associated protein [Galendromus occidentalis]
MWFQVTFVLAAASCAASAERKTPVCLNADKGSRICSSEDIANGATISELLQSIMSINVDREGLRQVTSKRFVELGPAAEGPFSPNEKITENAELVFDFLSGPESISKVGNSFFGSAVDAVYKIDLENQNHSKIYNANANCPSDEPCSRPLGMRIKENRLLLADAKRGLVEIDLSSGGSRVLLAIGTQINGTALTFPNDLDVDWDKEIVYMSDGSTKWSTDYSTLDILEADPNSRVIRFDIKSATAQVFAHNLRFANGIQISLDKKFLLVSEFSARQILKYPLDGPLPATAEPFTGLLPGNPDNIRPSLNGGYWVALGFGRPNGSRNLMDELQARPDLTDKLGNAVLTVGGLVRSMGTLLKNSQIRDLGSKVQTGHIILEGIPDYAFVVEFDVNGNILQTLQSTKYQYASEVLEHEDGLYISSPRNKYVLKVPRSAFRHAS